MRKGFTLIELLIVIAVIAILVGISLPRFRGMQAEGNTAKAAGELRALASAVESYYIHHSSEYPSQSMSVTSSWQSALTGASPKIISSTLSDPFKTTQQYSYATSAGSSSEYYVIFSVGPDGAAAIEGISTAGALTGDDAPGDDIYISNGTSAMGGIN